MSKYKYKYIHIIDGNIQQCDSIHPLNDCKKIDLRDKTKYINQFKKDVNVEITEISNGHNNLFSFCINNQDYNIFIEHTDGGGRDISHNKLFQKVSIPFATKSFANLISNRKNALVVDMYYELTKTENGVDINYNRYCYLIVMPWEIYSADPAGNIIHYGKGNGSSRWVTLNDINWCIKTKKTVINKNNNVWIVHPENLRSFLMSIVLDDYMHQKDLALDRYYERNIQKNFDDFNAKVIRARKLLRRKILPRKKCEILTCNINLVESLVVSHIWSVEEIKNSRDLTDEQKIKCIADENNTFLFCAIHDKLFDRYFITFDEHGVIKCSKKIRSSIQYYGFDPKKLNVPIININNENLPYLIKHNKIFEEMEKQRI